MTDAAYIGPWCDRCGDAFDGPERDCPRPAPGRPYNECGRGGHMFRLGADPGPLPKTVPCMTCGRAIILPPGESGADGYPCDVCASRGSRRVQAEWRADRAGATAKRRKGEPAP